MEMKRAAAPTMSKVTHLKTLVLVLFNHGTGYSTIWYCFWVIDLHLSLVWWFLLLFTYDFQFKFISLVRRSVS